MADRAMSWKNFNLSVKFGIAFGFAILLFITAILMYKVSADMTEKSYGELIEKHLKISELSSKVSLRLALCRNNEKNFLAESDMRHVKTFNTNVEQLGNTAGRIVNLAGEEMEEISALGKDIRKLSGQYKKLFGQVVASSRKIGLDETKGLRNEFGNAAATLEDRTGQFAMTSLFFAVLDLTDSADLYFNVDSKEHTERLKKDIEKVRNAFEKSNMATDTKEAIGVRMSDYIKWIEQSFGADASMKSIIKEQISGFQKALLDEIEKFYVPEAQVGMLEVRRAEKEYILNRRGGYAQKTFAELDDLAAIFNDSSLPSQRKDEISRFIRTYREAFNAFVDENERIQTLRRQMLDLVGEIEPEVESVAEKAEIMAEKQIRSAEASVDRINGIAAAIAIGVVVLVSLFIFFIVRSITRPLAQSSALAGTMAEGDLTGKMELAQEDEIGKLAGALNNMIANLRDIVGNIVSYTESLHTSSSGLTAISGEMTDSTQRATEKAGSLATDSESMSTNMNSVASASEQASTNLNMVASSVEEMDSTISEISQNSSKAKEIVDKAVKQGDSASERIKELGASAQDITVVVETITDISEQTNLLALNATIEAARAGEAGKGFGVVADEIKELANQAKKATNDIKERTGSIQESSDKTSGEIREIISIINEVNEIVLFVASAVEEQSSATKEIVQNINQASTGIEDVNRNINENAEVAGRISTGIADISKEAEELASRAEKVSGSADSLAEIGGKLKAMVERFKL
ncbi:MAG: HAMP domain-containing methyl-accepting chemotaxis protein [Desulfarculaceae bacterium]|nr:HAMP domain-containing methyl-accepting chemotaxis protein [Desulfarculaceae bacterium]